MKVIKPSVTILTEATQDDLLKSIEVAARTCYKSEDKIEEGSAERMVKALINRNHGAMLEHASIAVRVICDRGISHELVRHRLAAYAQESSRYCSYENGIVVIMPCYLERGTSTFNTWREACIAAEGAYRKMIIEGCKPEEARAVLPTSVKTEVVVTANVREWRHVIALRGSRAAHPQMRQLMRLVREKFVERYPVLFGDLPEIEGEE